VEPSQSSLKRPPTLLGQQDASALAGKRVLVAEDDPGTRRVLAMVLRSMGLDVIETDDGGRMLVAIAAQYKDGLTPEDLDLIITDVHLPVVGGLEVFRGLRAAHWTTPVIIVTGSDAPEVGETASRLGAVVLQKPIDLDVLETTVRRLLVPAPSPSRPAPLVPD
jgi:CheY-like chemotaxis protein